MAPPPPKYPLDKVIAGVGTVMSAPKKLWVMFKLSTPRMRDQIVRIWPYAKAVGQWIGCKIRRYGVILSAGSAAVAAVMAYNQVRIMNEERETPYRAVIYSAKVDGFRRYVAAASKLDSAFHTAVFVMPYNYEEPDIAANLSDEELAKATTILSFMIKEYTDFVDDVNASNLGWSQETRDAIENSGTSAAFAMSCYFDFGPGKPIPSKEWWITVRKKAAQDCPMMKDKVIAYHMAWAKAASLMNKDINGTPFAPIPNSPQDTTMANASK